jgi:hypothetical protein
MPAPPSVLPGLHLRARVRGTPPSSAPGMNFKQSLRSHALGEHTRLPKRPSRLPFPWTRPSWEWNFPNPPDSPVRQAGLGVQDPCDGMACRWRTWRDSSMYGRHVSGEPAGLGVNICGPGQPMNEHMWAVSHTGRCVGIRCDRCVFLPRVFLGMMLEVRNPWIVHHLSDSRRP